MYLALGSQGSRGTGWRMTRRETHDDRHHVGGDETGERNLVRCGSRRRDPLTILRALGSSRLIIRLGPRLLPTCKPPASWEDLV